MGKDDSVAEHDPPQRDVLAAVRGVLDAAGWTSGNLPRLVVSNVEWQGLAVVVRLTLHGQPLRLQLAAANPSLPALRRTASWNIGYMRGAEPSPEALTTLRAALDAVEAHDPGGLQHLRPVTVKAYARTTIDGKPRRTFYPEIFDAAFNPLVASGYRNERVVAVVEQACTMNCVFCPSTDRTNTHDSPFAAPEQLRDLLHQVRRGREVGATTIDFGGNDVLRFDGVLDVFRAAGDAGYTAIYAQSPGMVLANKAFAQTVAATPLTDVFMPIYGTTAAEHEAVSQVQGTFDQLCRAVDNLLELGGPKPHLATIALGSRMDRIDALMAFVSERFGLTMSVAPLRSNRQGERNLVLDVARLRDLRPLIARHPLAFSGEFPPCVFPRAQIWAQIDAGPRPEQRTPPLNLTDLGLPAESEEAAVAELRQMRHPAACGGCEAKPLCGGIVQHYLDLCGESDVEPFLR